MDVQTNAEATFRSLTFSQILDGVLLSNQAIGTGNTVISHRLDRQPLGYMIVDKTATGDVYRVSWNVKTITLISSAATTVSLWVF